VVANPELFASDLLPAADGGYLSEHCLRRPFARVCGLIGRGTSGAAETTFVIGD
jgi:hypothetical protein